MTIRCKWEIMHDILLAIQKGKHRITHIMYASNTNLRQLYPYKAFLRERGYIVYDEPFYNITSRGQDLLMHLIRVKEYLT